MCCLSRKGTTPGEAMLDMSSDLRAGGALQSTPISQHWRRRTEMHGMPGGGESKAWVPQEASKGWQQVASEQGRELCWCPHIKKETHDTIELNGPGSKKVISQ